MIAERGENLNILDKMIGYISPKTAFERLSWRSEMERNFNSAKSSRLPRNFKPVTGSAETTNKGSRDVLRSIARNLENNSDIAESVVAAFERNVIGSGFKLQIKTEDEDFNKKVEDIFKEWSKLSNCEITESLSFLDLQNIIMRRLVIDGGILIKKITDSKDKIPLRLQLIEVDELDKTHVVTNSTSRCYDGVETDLKNKPIKYHIKQYSAYGIPTTAISVNAKDMIYLRKIKRPSQIRELSEIARTSDRILSTDEYLDSISIKERVAACFAAFIKKATPTGGFGRNGGTNVSSESGQPLKSITPGMIQYLKPGEDATIVSPNGQASDTEKFVRTQQRLLSAGMGLSYETVARDLSQSNYSSARQNLLEDKETYKSWQRYLIDHFCEDVFTEFINALRLKGIIPLNMIDIPHEWVGSGWSWIDPLKEAKADEVALTNNLTTLQRVCAEKGLDWKEVLEQRRKEKELLEELCLVPVEQTNKKEEGEDATTE